MDAKRHIKNTAKTTDTAGLKRKENLKRMSRIIRMLQ